MKNVYVCAKYRDNNEQGILMNITRAIWYGEMIRKKKMCPVIPHLASTSRFGIYGNNKKVTKLDDILLKACDEMWVFGTFHSEGMKHEIKVATECGIKIKYVKLR